MKMKITVLMLTFCLRAYAPGTNTIPVFEAEGINPYRKLITAIGMVETKLDTMAYNPEEEATGFFQIRPIRLRHYNQLTGNSHTLAEMYDYKTAERIFLFYAMQIGPYNQERIARNWNGSGPMTKEYWKKVKACL